MKVNVIAEIGINYAYGEYQSAFVRNAKKLIDVATVAGCDFVKLQKRTPELCVPKEQQYKEKKVPWRKDPTTYIQYKKDIEFGEDEYRELIEYASYKDTTLFASVWDIESAKFMADKTSYVKIPSAKITDHELLKFCKKNFEHRIMSTGMSTEKEINTAVLLLNPTVLMHTNSAYPTPVESLNLGYIQWLKDEYTFEGNPEVGLSSHFYGLTDAIYAMGMGITWLEKHLTLNHDLWGSDQSASVEPHGFFEMMKKIRDMEQAERGYGPRLVLSEEISKRKSLRG